MTDYAHRILDDLEVAYPYPDHLYDSDEDREMRQMLRQRLLPRPPRPTRTRPTDDGRRDGSDPMEPQ